MKTKKIRLNVCEALGTPTALTRDQGEMIFEKICKIIDDHSSVQLDFSDIESVLSPFLNVAVGKLYSKYSSETLNNMLEVTGISDDLFDVFEIVISNAKSFYKNSSAFNDAVKDVCN